jgi:sortase A
MSLVVLDLSGRDLPSPPPDRSRSRFGAALEAALWIFALVCLGLVGWWQLDSWMYQKRARALLVEETRSQPGATLRLSRAPRPTYAIGAPMARLSIPRLDMSMIVAEGVTDSVLRRAAGHLPGSAHPGEKGNVAIAGHRDTFFRGLEDLRVGDSVLLDGPDGAHRYQVQWTAVVYPHAGDVAGPTDYAALTLITCYPFRYVGAAPYRFIARARLVDR